MLIMAVTRTIFKIKMDDREARLAWYDATHVLMKEASGRLLEVSFNPHIPQGSLTFNPHIPHGLS